MAADSGRCLNNNQKNVRLENMSVYCTCKYAPAELMAGFGEKLERLDPAPAAFTCAEGCTHPNMCSFAKAVIEEVQQKEIRQLILTDCCDAMRRVYDVLLAGGQMEFLWFLPLPHKDGPAEIRLFRENLEKLAENYAGFSGRSFDAEKAEEAYRNWSAAPPVHPGGFHISIAGAHGGKRLLALAEDIFPEVPVVDDTCSGNRTAGMKNPEKADSLQGFCSWYAEALLDQENPCMRMQRPENGPVRIGAAASGEGGTIFHTIKFCDYYGFQYMSAKDGTSGKLVRVESDTTGTGSGQLRTRLEAFREELGMGALSRDRHSSEDRMGSGSAGAGMHSGMCSAERSGSGSGKRFVAGIDSGSASTDAVIMDTDRNILARVVLPTAAGAESSSEAALAQALSRAGLRREDLALIVTTGYGRGNIKASDRTVTEITCHARGAHFLDPDVRTVIDIGGQDSKVIRIDGDGKVQNFVMNDKCAAGTGRFLEMQADTLGLSMEEMSSAGLKWQKDLTITSMCTVFAGSEVVSLIADNTPAADIIHGLNKAIAGRTAALVSRVGGKAPFIMTGGVAKNRGVVKCLEESLGERISVPEDAQVCGAIGACLEACEKL